MQYSLRSKDSEKQLFFQNGALSIHSKFMEIWTKIVFLQNVFMDDEGGKGYLQICTNQCLEVIRLFGDSRLKKGLRSISGGGKTKLGKEEGFLKILSQNWK